MRYLSISNEKKWKYLSFVLMGIIATGVLAPTAFAANPTLEEVLANVIGIKAKTDNLPTDPASDTTVNTRATPADVNNAKNEIIAAMPSVGANCVTIDVNRDGLLDRFEISPRPHIGVNYEGCDLRGASLGFASLFGANLAFADLTNANLNNADLRFADLTNANLFNANLFDADLTNADLTNADLTNADLSVANLFGATLSGANFTGADLTGANFTNCIGDPVGTPAAGTLPDCA